MVELTTGEVKKIDERIENEVSILESRENGGEFRWARQILNTIPGAQAIERDWKKFRLKYSTDKWNQKEKKCGRGECGLKPRDNDYWWFCSEECKKTYCEYLKNFKEGEKAYQILTGGNTSTPRTNNREPCDYCRNYYFFNYRFPRFKSLAKGFGRDKEESYWFCSGRCYNNFFVCHYCGRKRSPGENVRSGSGWILSDYLQGTGYAFCSLSHKQQANQSRDSNNQQKCYQCGREPYQKNAKGQTIFLYPPEAKDKLFCCSECIEARRKGLNSPPNIELLRSEAIKTISDFLAIEPEVRTEELEPSNQNWAAALQNAQEEEIRSIESAVLEDARKKRAAKAGKSSIRALLELAKSKDDFEELFSIVKQLKEFRLTEGYQEFSAEIEQQEARLRDLNPSEYHSRINGSFEQQIKNRGLTYQKLSAKTKAAMTEAQNTGKLEKVKIAEELIEVDGSLKDLKQLLVQVSQTQIKSEKAKLLNQLLVFIKENIFNQRAYLEMKSEVDKVVNQLIRETQTETNSSGEDFPYLPIFLSLMAVLVVGAGLLLIWKRKQRG